MGQPDWHPSAAKVIDTHPCWAAGAVVYILYPPSSPVGQAEKLEASLEDRIPLQPTENPGEGLALVSHWNCVVGGVRMQPRPF